MKIPMTPCTDGVWAARERMAEKCLARAAEEAADRRYELEGVRAARRENGRVKAENGAMVASLSAAVVGLLHPHGVQEETAENIGRELSEALFSIITAPDLQPATDGGWSDGSCLLLNSIADIVYKRRDP